MRFPDVLIIGAMKAGTTGLYMDLCEHPEVYLADDKEPHALCHDEVLSKEGQARYAQIYARAAANQLCIDASTGYSKRPDFQSVAERAARLLPSDFKVIYLVRHPIERIISQHYHEFSIGEVGPDINEVVRTHSRYANYSRYYYQLEPWIQAVGSDRIKVLRFEDYVDRRAEVVESVLEFLGVSTNCAAIDVNEVYNRSEGKPVRNRFWSSIYENSAYRRLVRPFLPVKLRLALLKALLPRAPERPEPPSLATVRWLRKSLVEDVTKLESMLDSRKPLWKDLYDEDTVPHDSPPKRGDGIKLDT